MKIYNVMIGSETEYDSDAVYCYDDEYGTFIKDKMTDQRIKLAKNVTRPSSDNFNSWSANINVNGFESSLSYICSEFIHPFDDAFNTLSIGLNNRNMNPIIVKDDKYNVNGDDNILYITIDIENGRYDMVDYFTKNRIFQTYHTRKKYGCAVQFKSSTNNEDDNRIISAYLWDNVNKKFIGINIREGSNNQLMFNVFNVTDTHPRYNSLTAIRMKRTVSRFKLKLDTSDIPTIACVCNTYDFDRNKLRELLKKSHIRNPKVVYIGGDERSFDSSISYMKKLFTDNKIRAVTLFGDTRIPFDIFSELKISHVFTYNAEKDFIRCIKSN